MSKPQTLTDDIRQIQQEAGGVMYLHVLQPADLGELMAMAILGDPEAARLAGAAREALRGIATAPRRCPKLCGCCPRPIRRRGEFSIIIAAPARDDARNCLALAICARCATDHEGARSKAMIALRGIWPDARQIDVQLAPETRH